MLLTVLGDDATPFNQFWELIVYIFFFSSRRRHTRSGDWSSDVCSSDLAARLSGEPNTVTIFDVGEWNERPFIVMEHLSGGTLDGQIAREGPQPADRALGWLEQAAEALDHAHGRGVVHRDVKPGNLLLDRDANVHVADFGIASAAG